MFQLAMAIDLIDGTIRQIMFHPNLLIYCALAVTIISLATNSISKSQKLEAPRGEYKWDNHPLIPILQLRSSLVQSMSGAGMG